MKNSTRKWIRAGGEAFITGATSSLSAVGGATILDPGHWGASVNSLKLMGISALFGGGIRFAHWWNTNPLPPETDTAPPVPGVAPVVLSMNPMAKSVPAPSAPLTAQPPTP